MIATDRLIAMLDERGVEYVIDHEYGEKYPPEQRVTWSVDLAGEDMTVTARDYCIGVDENGKREYYCLDLEFHEVFTPEQAIESTLGQGTCHIVKTWTESDYADHWRYSCSECGYPIEVGERDVATGDPVSHANFCWNCGREVVDK